MPKPKEEKDITAIFREGTPIDQAMRKALREAIRDVMAKIERAGLIKTTGKTIEVLRDNFHLPAAHSLYPNYRMQMRLKALDHMQTRPKDEHYSFSVIYSANETSRNQIRARFLEFIDWAQTLTQNEESAHVYQINFDLLRWG